jgi:hypothetical protein
MALLPRGGPAATRFLGNSCARTAPHEWKSSGSHAASRALGRRENLTFRVGHKLICWASRWLDWLQFF